MDCLVIRITYKRPRLCYIGDWVDNYADGSTVRNTNPIDALYYHQLCFIYYLIGMGNRFIGLGDITKLIHDTKCMVIGINENFCL